MSKKYSIFLSNIISVSFLSITGCEQLSVENNDSTTIIKTTEKTTTNSTQNNNNPTYQVLVDTKHPPYTFRDVDGNIVGFEVDILKAVAEKERFNLQLVTSSSAELFKDLSDKKYDIAMSALEVSPELKKKVSKVASFTDSYISTVPIIAYISPEPMSLKKFTQSKIGVKEGASYLPALNKEIEKNQIKLRYYNSDFLSLKNVINGNVSASIIDVQSAFYYIEQFKNEGVMNEIKITPVLNNKNRDVAIAVSKDQPELLATLNRGLKKIQEDGDYDAISAKWLK